MEASSAIALAQWSAIAIALGGNVLVNKKDVRGFYAWFIANLFWIVTCSITNQWPQLVLFAAYEVLCVHGIYKWLTEEK